MWEILCALYDRHAAPPTVKSIAKPCAFCGRFCGRTARECAETNGARKALKDKIRGMEAARAQGSLPSALGEVLDELYNCYVTVSPAQTVAGPLITASSGRNPANEHFPTINPTQGIRLRAVRRSNLALITRHSLCTPQGEPQHSRMQIMADI